MSILKLKDENGNWNSIPTLKGDTGNGIESTVLNSDYTLTINYTDGTDYTTPSIRGEKGNTGSTGAKGDKGDRGDQGVQGERGLTGATPNLTIGTVDTLTPNDDATVNITGTAENPVLNFGIPKGDIGEVTNDDLTKLAIKDTASGSIASFMSDVDNIPMNSVKVRIDPVQDLHGLDAPYPAGGRNNILPFASVETDTRYGITWIKNNDGSITISGTATQSTPLYFVDFKLPAGDYLFSNTGSTVVISGASADFYIRDMDNALTLTSIRFGVTYDSRPFTLSTETNVRFYAVVQVGATVSGTVYPMIRLSTITDSSYIPYSNICPIEGWDAINVYDDPVYTEEIEWNQLVKLDAGFPTNVEGVTITANPSTGAITLNGSATGNSNKPLNNLLETYDGEHILYLGGYEKIGSNTGYIGISGAAVDYGNGGFYKLRKENFSGYRIRIDIRNGDVFNNTVMYPQCFDVTKIFGESKANEIYAMEQEESGSGVAYFKSLFPKDYYPYNEGEKTCVSAVNGNPYRHATIDLGQTVYGGTVDIATGELIIDKACVDLGTLWWSSGFNGFISPSLKDVIVNVSSNEDTPNIISSEYKTAPYVNRPDKSISLIWHTDPAYTYINYIVVKDSTYSDVATFKAAMSGVQLVYELAEPISVNVPHSELRSILGQNKIFADSGDVDITYCVDTKTYIDTIAEDHQEQIATKASLDDVVDKAPVITDTTSGAIASFTDGADDLPLKSLIVDINPIQDLHGQANPYPAGGGANQWDEQWEEGTINSSTGAKQTSATKMRSVNYIPVSPNTEYRYICTAESGIVFYYGTDKSYISNYNIPNGARTFTTPADCYYILFTPVTAYGNIYHNDISIVLASSGVTTYSPYENICPISGWTEVDVEHTGSNIFDITNKKNLYVGGSDSISVGEDGVLLLFSTKVGTTYTMKKLGGDRNMLFGTNSPIEDVVTRFKFTSKTIVASSPTYTFVAEYSTYAYYANTTWSDTIGNDFVVNVGSTVGDYESYTGTSLTIDLGQTVYGGTLNVLTGELVVDRYVVDPSQWTQYGANNGYKAYRITNAPKAFGQTNTVNKPLSNMISEFGTFSSSSMNKNIIQPPYPNYNFPAVYMALEDDIDPTSVEFSYILREPITIQLDSHTLNSLYGANNIWADSGDTEVEYRADTKLFIERLTAPDSADMIADANITSGQYFMVGNSLYKATANIANGSSIIVGTNAVRKSLSEALNEINA